MPEDVMKMLGPWPILQFMFGIAVLGFGVYMIIRGVSGKKNDHGQLEDRRSEWAAYEQLRNIEENSFKMLRIQEQTLEAIKALAAAIWNRGV